MIDNSKVLHEINILAKLQNKNLAVECKNYGEARIVGIKEVRDFQGKLQDLPEVTDGMFMTNTSFSSEAETYANTIRYHYMMLIPYPMSYHLYNL
jgi:restriction endonuclease Mrr